jgi:galactokinase
MSGSDFLKRYQGITDHVTRVDPNRSYAVRAPTLHPILENERAHRFRCLIRARIEDATLREMGQLMYAAHDSYTACGLASDGTDLLVEFVREAGPSRGLYGAKITGGGSGGTVAILGHTGADDTINEIARRYSERTGRQSQIFRGSSPGAYGTPVQQLLL